MPGPPVIVRRYFSTSFKHAFDFWYKWCPAGSLAVGDSWPNGSWFTTPLDFAGGPNAKGLTNGFYNMGYTNLGLTALTRNPAVRTPQDQVTTVAVTGTSPDESALPWGSSAIDLLWNVQNLSSSISFVTSPINGTKACDTIVSFTYGTDSFNYHNWGYEPEIQFNALPGIALSKGYGLAEYPVTSSWTVYESKLNDGGNPLVNLRYVVRSEVSSTGSNIYYPATLIQQPKGTGYAKPTTRTYNTPSYAEKPNFGGVGTYIPPNTARANSTSLPAGFNPTDITYTDASTGSFDGRFYDLTGGCGITRGAIETSMQLYDANATDNTVTGLDAKTTALKNRRLFFPTILTGSSNITTFNEDGFPGSLMPETPNPNPIGTEWLGLINSGQGSDIYFNENGGIYNVKFNLKRDLDNDYYPDQGAAELLVYIHNINTTVPASDKLTPGASGWLPPENNIVRVKNNPAMSFLNPATGFQIETFNINLVQYGVPAQLVFEASGSLATNEFFGCVIDDVTFCKVGVSTDPDLIKPETSADNIYQQLNPGDR